VKHLWDKRRVIVCVGSGGVGKTTVAATLGLAAAASGLRTLVITIDPALRLANVLGLKSLTDVEHEISPELAKEHGIALNASMYVMMLDLKDTFDSIIRKVAPNPETREGIYNNRFYQQFSTELVGALEYAAVEKLYEVYTSGRYDLIVLDTPPAQHALTFLDAPRRLAGFLGHEAFHWMIQSTQSAFSWLPSFMQWGQSMVLSGLKKVGGDETINELLQFVSHFSGMHEGFRDRAREVERLLKSDEVLFVMVSTCRHHQTATVKALREALTSDGMEISHLVLNRVPVEMEGGCGKGELEAELSDALAGLSEDEQSLLDEIMSYERQSYRLSRSVATEIQESLGHVQCTELPEIPMESSDLAHLSILYRHFFEAKAFRNQS
jgi:anion-transporting  ArsA/GET3 family ATPase